MKILALEKDLSGVSQNSFTKDILKEEAARIWQLHQSGAIRELYFRADRQAAVLILECANVDDAKAVLATLPLVQRKLIQFELIPLMAYSGLSRLFHDQ
jgi:muconolactone delta-isomerase